MVFLQAWDHPSGWTISVPAVTATTMSASSSARSAPSRQPPTSAAMRADRSGGLGQPPGHRSASLQTEANCHTACARSHIGVDTKMPPESMNAVARLPAKALVPWGLPEGFRWAARKGLSASIAAARRTFARGFEAVSRPYPRSRQQRSESGGTLRHAAEANLWLCRAP